MIQEHNVPRVLRGSAFPADLETLNTEPYRSALLEAAERAGSHLVDLEAAEEAAYQAAANLEAVVTIMRPEED